MRSTKMAKYTPYANKHYKDSFSGPGLGFRDTELLQFMVDNRQEFSAAHESFYLFLNPHLFEVTNKYVAVQDN